LIKEGLDLWGVGLRTTPKINNEPGPRASGKPVRPHKDPRNTRRSRSRRWRNPRPALSNCITRSDETAKEQRPIGRKKENYLIRNRRQSLKKIRPPATGGGDRQGRQDEQVQEESTRRGTRRQFKGQKTERKAAPTPKLFA